MNHATQHKRLTSTFLALALLTPAAARADEITLAAPNAQTPGQKLRDATILRIDKDQLIFRLANGSEAKRELARVAQLSITSDPSLTTGEAAFVSSQWSAAVDGYLKAIRSNDEWKVRWIAPRLTTAASKANRFDGALAAYIALSKIDPAAATNARPALPAKPSKFLDDAVGQLDAASRAATTDSQRQALLALLLDVHLARGDSAAVATTGEQLGRLLGDRAADDPRLAALVGDVKLGQARVALSAKRFADVITAIDADAPRFTTVRQQAEALLLRADARRGLTSAEDRNGQLDCAFEYMRVAALAGAPGATDDAVRPLIAQALLGAANVTASAGNTADARRLCQQLAAEFPNTPAATAANELAANLPAASPQPTNASPPHTP